MAVHGIAGDKSLQNELNTSSKQKNHVTMIIFIPEIFNMDV